MKKPIILFWVVGLLGCSLHLNFRNEISKDVIMMEEKVDNELNGFLEKANNMDQ